MSPSRLLPAGLGLLFLIAPAFAFAQTPGQRIIIGQPGVFPGREGLVRIQSSINFFLPGPTGEGEEAQKLRDRARRTLYEMAVHECDLLREVLAKDCRLETVNSNLNIGRQYGQQEEGLNINGSMSLQVTLK